MTQRIIKLRSWNGNKMFECGIRRDGKCADFFCQDEADIYDYPVMQFTGLLDRNGKEIYEGDIVKVWDMNRCCEECEMIENGEKNMHREDCECYVTTQEIKWSDWGGYYCEEDTGDGCMGLGSDEFEFEIIGNIYQNPELIK